MRSRFRRVGPTVAISPSRRTGLCGRPPGLASPNGRRIALPLTRPATSNEIRGRGRIPHGRTRLHRRTYAVAAAFPRPLAPCDGCAPPSADPLPTYSASGASPATRHARGLALAHPDRQQRTRTPTTRHRSVGFLDAARRRAPGTRASNRGADPLAVPLPRESRRGYVGIPWRHHRSSDHATGRPDVAGAEACQAQRA